MKNLTNLKCLKNYFLILPLLFLNFYSYSYNNKPCKSKTNEVSNLLERIDSDIVWPTNWDGLPEHNPMLECNSGFELDTLGNPHPNKTGYPTLSTCAKIYVTYIDQLYSLACGTTILREWTVEDSCTGDVNQKTQIIRITDSTAPEFNEPTDFTVKPGSYTCDADVEIPKLVHLIDNCDPHPKWWVSSQDKTILGDDNNNGFVDVNETWVIENLSIGQHSICYHVTDNCDNLITKCINVSVSDNVPPIPACEQYINVSLTAQGIANIFAANFDSGSFDNCSAVHYKALRVNPDLKYDGSCIELNGDDNPITPEMDVWYDDQVSFCSEDAGKQIMVSLRVFDIDPGIGPINSIRMEYGGDLYRHFNDCWTVVTVENKIGLNTDIVAACESNILTSISLIGNSEISSNFFNVGSSSPNGNLFFRAIRINDSNEIDSGCPNLNGDDDTTTVENDVWYDDKIYFCCEDVNKETVVSVRVFDKNPGTGAINPNRMKQGGDLFNHFNDCYTIVQAKNKIPPAIDCDDITVFCSESIDPSDNSKLNPHFISVCGDEILDYLDEINSDSSVIKRKWTITTTSNGLIATCTQTITIIDTITPFDPCTIKFPKDQKLSCAYKSHLSKPTWVSNGCNNITAKVISEDTFTFVDDACTKILRNWAVIDWDTYENNFDDPASTNIDSLTGNKLNCDQLVADGYYRYTQIVTLLDFTTPKITAKDLCLGSDDCNAYDLLFEATAVDTCDIDQKFNWKYIITNMDTWETIQYSYNYTPEPTTGIVGKRTKDKLDRTDKAEIIMRVPLPIGNYRISWTVGDGCGNATTLHQSVVIADKKAPTPIMVDIATAVMENGMIAMKARTFDKGGCDNGCISSVDNCTDKDGLYFSFSDKVPHIWDDTQGEWAMQLAKYGKYFFDPSTGQISTHEKYLAGEADAWLMGRRTSERIFLCNIIEGEYSSRTIQIYVFDKFDDSDEVGECDTDNFAFSNVLVNFKCVGDSSATVEGTVKTVNGKLFTGMKMKVTGNDITKYTETFDGKYLFDLDNGHYFISGYSNIDSFEGVNTADLIYSKEVLLGLKEISPFQRIAMDINNSYSITTSDIVSLQRLIVKKTDSLNNPAWIAISNNFDFENHPFDESNATTQVIDVYGFPIKDVDFTAVKMGDVDNSVYTVPKLRIDNGTTMIVENKTLVKGQLLEIPIYAKNFTDIKGFQFSMNITGLEINDIESDFINFYSYNIINNNLLVSSIINNSFKDNDLLFTLKVIPSIDGKVKDIFSLNDYEIRTEAYSGTDLDVNKINLEFKTPVATNEISRGFELFQNKPNPFSNKTVIGFNLPQNSDYKLTIFDVAGKKLFKKEYLGKGKEGYNSITIDINDFPSKGMYIYKLESENNTAIKKMVVQ